MNPPPSIVLEVGSAIRVPLTEFRFTFARSGGPGGQNVNKVSTKATLHWPVSCTPSLPDDVRNRLMARHRRQVNKQGELVVHSQRFRDRERNIEDCLEKLQAMLERAAQRPKPRKKTRPTAASQRRRLDDKRARSETKSRRRELPHE